MPRYVESDVGTASHSIRMVHLAEHPTLVITQVDDQIVHPTGLQAS